MKVVINGCGIAGPALAWWLRHYGHEPLLVEQAPRLREGGYVIDFWGLGYDIAEKMGLIPQIRALGYQVEEVRFVDGEGRGKGGFNVDTLREVTHDRFTSVRRSDLSAAILAPSTTRSKPCSATAFAPSRIAVTASTSNSSRRRRAMPTC